MRLQRYLALAGVASRRAAEGLIVAGRVRVDGEVVRRLGTTVEADAVVEVDGARVVPAAEREVVALNKPLGVVTTMRDPQRRRTIADVVAATRGRKAPRLFPVGRLDYDTGGLLLLTNDGDLAFALAHPRFEIDKVYRATVRGRLEPEAVTKLRDGLHLGRDERPASPARLRVIATARDRSVVDLTIHEGRYRQIRRMFAALGHPVLELTRLRFGPIALGSLRPGELRPLGAKERAALEAIVRR
ncbi:MAG: rRNA pseudouridine synthase [Candidatus Eremiobacteraeota bacterium]|nr:rRNA pseudouridine synthase [Candidatus Eremiobacteraeota bacterium]